MGIMEEIKQHLKDGKTVKELVELGFKKPSIYKCRKQMKDDEKPDEKPDTILDEIQEDIDIKPNNTITDNIDNSNDNQETTEEEETDPDSDPEFAGLEQEIFSDDENSFQEFDGVDIRRDVITIPSSTLISGKPKVVQTGKGTGKIGLEQLLTELYATIAILTGHEHWNLKTKDQKVIKHLCKIPGLEKFLHRFGIYGCVIGLFTITFSRIKVEIQLRKEPEQKQEQKQEIKSDIRPDSPVHIMAGFINEK